MNRRNFLSGGISASALLAGQAAAGPYSNPFNPVRSTVWSAIKRRMRGGVAAVVATATDNVIVSSTGQVQSGTASVTTNFTSRRADYASPQGDITNLKTVDTGFIMSGSGVTAGPAFTIKRYLEYPAGTFHQVTWGSAATILINGGNPSSATSDIILSSFTGQPIVIAKGDEFWWRTVNVSAATVGSFPVIVRPASSQTLGIDDGNSTTDQGNSGTIAASSGTNTFGPAAVIGTVKAVGARAFLLFGDSLVFGVGDETSVGAFQSSGWFSRGLAGVYPSAKVALGGVTVQNWSALGASFTNYLNRIGYTDVIQELGINDLSANSRTPAQVLADQQTAYGLFSGHNLFGSARIWQTTMTARTSSTNSYADAAGQTPKTDGTYGQVNSLNGSIRAKPSLLYGVIDAADFDMTARDSVIHAGPFPPTSDGTHFLGPKAADMGSRLVAAVAI